jgi:transposase
MKVEGIDDGAHGRAMGSPQPIISVPLRRTDGRGCPWRDPRAVLNEILRLLRTGAQRQDLPPRDPPYHTCHRRFQLWGRSGVRDHLLRALATGLHGRGRLDLSACVIDGTCVVAPKGGAGWERPKVAKSLNNSAGDTFTTPP